MLTVKMLARYHVNHLAQSIAKCHVMARAKMDALRLALMAVKNPVPIVALVYVRDVLDALVDA
jgi:hypothetical protein